MAVGCIGMSFDEFCGYSFDEFESICKAWREKRDAEHQDAWERMRILAAITIQPHIRKKLTPKQLLPLPWDGDKKAIRGQDTEALSPLQRLRRFEELI